ncbi:MAG: hypothetical protein FJZ64_00880 [Chlamydiae bacterium]|nr:hypothetical protein [Chlamydiota bacterium]
MTICRVISDLGQDLNNNIFQVSYPNLQREPISVLLALQIFRECNLPFPLIRYETRGLVDTVGIDVGGITRDFITRIFKSIFENRIFPLREDNGSFFPLLEGADGEKKTQISTYQVIGWIYALALRGYQKIQTGQYMHPDLFTMIHALQDAEVQALPDRIEDISQIPERIYKRILKSYLKLQARHLFGPDTADHGVIDRDIDVFVENGTINAYSSAVYQTRDELLEGAQANEGILAVLNIAKSMHKHIEWFLVERKTPEELEETIQGRLTKECVLRALEKRDGTDTDFQAVKGYVERYVQEATDEELADFVWAVSGKKSIALGERLYITACVQSEQLPVFHTCSRQMDIPHYPNYDTFKILMTRSVTEAKASCAFGGLA